MTGRTDLDLVQTCTIELQQNTYGQTRHNLHYQLP